MQIFQSANPEASEKGKTGMAIEDLIYNLEKGREVLQSISTLLRNDLLSTVEAQLKVDQCIENFITYVNSPKEAY